MEKTTEIDKMLSYIVEQLDSGISYGQHSAEPIGYGDYMIIRHIGDDRFAKYAITCRLLKRMVASEAIRDAVIMGIHSSLNIAELVLNRRPHGVGGDNLSAVIAQDHAPGHARAMSKFSEFGKTVKP